MWCAVCGVVVWCELSTVCFEQCLCAVSLWCGVSYLLSVWCACVVCSVPLSIVCSVQGGVLVSVQCACMVCSELFGVQCAVFSVVLVCSELVVWCELSAAHIGHKSSSNQDINGNLKVL